MLNINSLLHKLVTDTVFITGDQNLLRGASTISGTTGTWTSETFRTSGSGGTVAYNQAITPPSGYTLPSQGATITSSSASQQIGFCQDGCPIEQKEITFSVWVKGQSGDRVTLQPIWSGTSGQEESGALNFTLTNSEWQHLSYTKTPNYAHSSVSLGYVYYYAPSGHVLSVLAPKIEYNSLPTAWTDNAKMSGPLYVGSPSGLMVGSKQETGTVNALLLKSLQQTNGQYQIGSLNLTTQYSKNGIVIPTGWYNYLMLFNNVILLGMTVTEKLFHLYLGNASDGSSTVADMILINNGTITKSYPTNSATSNYNLNGTAGTHYYYCKYGNIVTVNFNVKCTTPTNSWTTFATGLPTHCHPTEISTVLGCETADKQPLWVQITSSGQIQAYGGVAGYYYYGSICYVTNS